MKTFIWNLYEIQRNKSIIIMIIIFLFCLKKEMCIDLKKKGTIIKGEKLCMVIHDQH